MWLIIKEVDGRTLFSVPLSEGRTIIGRGKGATLIILDGRLSARHVEIERTGDEVKFRDLGSSMGTHLKGERVTEGSLDLGSALKIGETIVLLSQSYPRSRDEIRQSAPTQAQPLGNLKEFVERLQSNNSPRELLEDLLSVLLAQTKAERGFVLLKEKIRGGLVPVASHSINEVDEFVSLSTSVYQKAVSEKKPIVIDDTTQLAPGTEALSMALYPAPRTIICCPIFGEDEPYGALYLDMKRKNGGFPAPLVDFVQAAAAIASERLAVYKTRWRLVTTRDRFAALNALAWEDNKLVLGDGPAAKELRKTIAVAALRGTTALIIGETGTGKEMVARALHYASERRDSPFVPVNCAALPKDLIEAELFGAERGAFTGSTERRLGRFELASGGTLFLDEVGELPLETQVKLLRVLQERKVRRLGSNQEIDLDFTLVCATNRPLEEAVKEGTFRADFYYRINVFPIELKALRERQEDIRPLANHFLTQFSKRFGRNLKGFSEEAQRLLLDYPWPGNVRELRNVIERAVVVESSGEITPSSLPLSSPLIPVSETTSGDVMTLSELPRDYEKAKGHFERAFLKRSLVANEGNIAAVVRESGLGRPTVYRWMKRHNIRPDGQSEE